MALTVDPARTPAEVATLPPPPLKGSALYEHTEGGILIRSAPRPGGSRGFTAAARRLDPRSSKDKQEVKIAPAWHPLAWTLYDEVGEVKYAGRFHGKCLSKLRVYPAIRVRPEDEPIPITDILSGEVDLEVPIPQLERINQACNDVLRRIDDGALGGMSELQMQYGINMFVAGECSIVGYATPDEMDPERWLIASSSTLVLNTANQMALKLHKGWRNQDLIVLDDETMVTRIWNQHPQWPEMPDSSIRGVLEIAETLWFLTQEVKGTAMSRLNAGILKIPNGLLTTTTPGDEPDQPHEDEHPLIRKIYDHLEAPIGDPTSASITSPFVLNGEREDLAAVEHMTMDRPHDAQAAKDREEFVRRFAQGVDLPPEVVTGLADINHWSAWTIDANTFNIHIEPVIKPYCWAFGRDVMIPLVQQAIPDVDLMGLGLTTWFDASELVAQPDQKDLANDASDRGMIGGVWYRKLTGLPEEAAPTPEEVAARNATPDFGDDPDGDQPAEVDPGPPQGGTPGRTAAAVPTTVSRSRLGAQLAEIDKALLARLSTSADAAVNRAIERAGAKLRTKARAASGAHAEAARTVSNLEIGQILGPSLVAQLATTDELMETSFAAFALQFERDVRQAQRQALRTATQGLDVDDADLAQIEREQEDNRGAAWAWLSAALLVVTTARLFDPKPSAPPLGEFDENVSVPPGVIRQALVVAGGDTAPATLSPGANIAALSGTPIGGVATGTTIEKVLKQFPVKLTKAEQAEAAEAAAGRPGVSTPTREHMHVIGYVWVYGSPATRTQPFDPHLFLDGTKFDRFDDEVLANSSGWPNTSHYYPGDHVWCQCNYEPIFRASEED